MSKLWYLLKYRIPQVRESWRTRLGESGNPCVHRAKAVRFTTAGIFTLTYNDGRLLQVEGPKPL